MPSTATDRLAGLTTSVAVKAPCRLKTTANHALSGLAAIDGVTPVAGDRILVGSNTDATENGIYVAGASAWERALDFNGTYDAVGGTQVLVISGSVNANSYWRISGTGTVAIGTDEIAFTAAFIDDSASATFMPAGTDPVATTVQAKLRNYVSLTDKGTVADALAAFESLFADFANGGYCFIPPGNWLLSGTATFTGQRINLEGAAITASSIWFDPASADVALDMNNAAPVGCVQSSIRRLMFSSTNSVDKTAIRLVNVANCQVEDIGIAEEGWEGSGSIGIHSLGRQLLEVNRATIACARPIVFSQNATFTSLSTDHYLIFNSEFVGTSATKPVIEFEDGVSFAQTKIWNTAVVGGKDGILWNDTSSTAASFNLDINNVRTEQGLDATAYAIRLESTAQNLQNVNIHDCQLGNDRNGIYLRNAQRVTVINTVFNQPGKTAFDMTFVPGSSLRLINCQGAGTFTFTNARCVSRHADSRALFINEEWVYDANDSSGAVQSDVPWGGDPFTLASGAVAVLTDDTFCGWTEMVTTEDVGAIYFLRGQTHSVSERDDTDNFFTPTKDNASTVNIYWETDAYKIQNNRPGSVTFSKFRRGSNIGA